MRSAVRVFLPAVVAIGLLRPGLAGELFEYGRGERVVFEHAFNDATGWTLDKTLVSGGELKARPGASWTHGRQDFPPLDLHYGDIGVYWSFASTPRSGDAGNLRTNLEITKDPDRIEQRLVCLNVRPGWHHIFYIDPGFFVFPHDAEVALTGHRGSASGPVEMFEDASRYESFRLMIRKSGSDAVLMEPYYWDRVFGVWLMYREHTGAAPAIIASIKDNMEGRTYFETIDFGMVSDIARVRSCAITQVHRFSEDQMKRQAAEVRLQRVMDLCRVGKVTLDSSRSAVLRVARSNPTDSPVREALRWQIADGSKWKISPESAVTSLAPGERRELRFAVALTGDLPNAFPLPRLESTLTFRAGEGGARTVTRSRVLPIDLAASFAKPLVGTCVRAEARPVVDGRLDDPVWRACRGLSRFVAYDPRYEVSHPAACVPTSYATEGRFAYDADNLYISFRCDEPNLEGLVTKVTDRDGRTWADDSVDFWLATDPQNSAYYHYSVNANSVVLDEERVGQEGSVNKDWDGPCVAKVGREPEAWTLEISLPWDALGVAAPEPGLRIGLQVQRMRAQATKEMSQWSPTFTGNMGYVRGHVRSRLGVLVLE